MRSYPAQHKAKAARILATAASATERKKKRGRSLSAWSKEVERQLDKLQTRLGNPSLSQADHNRAVIERNRLQAELSEIAKLRERAALNALKKPQRALREAKRQKDLEAQIVAVREAGERKKPTLTGGHEILGGAPSLGKGHR